MVTIIYGNEKSCIDYVNNKYNSYINISIIQFISFYKNKIELHSLNKTIVINNLELDKDNEDMQLYTARVFKLIEVNMKELILINPAKISVGNYGESLFYNLLRSKERVLI